MSRLGDLILLERTRQKLTRKQVAKKCGVAESYLKDVEEGRRIIQDDQARRILRTLGTSQRNEAEFSLDEIAATVDLSTLAPQTAPAARQPAPQPKAAPEAPKPRKTEDQSGIWLDALSSVLQPVPIMNAGWIQISRRLVPIQDGKIEGAKPEKVVYFQSPDDSMRAMRIAKGDLVLVVPQTLPVDDAIMLVEYGAHR
ncbi:MAG: helix-turn-helix transcriptional regulator, partial [Clostridia bacterium]|nr:helix-turn-helix transcriptional regulator [Clostridia bacterium]